MTEENVDVAALQKQLDELKANYANVAAENDAVKAFIGKQDGETRAKFEAGLQEAKTAVLSDRQAYEAARKLKAFELANASEGLLTADELLSKTFRNPSEMEVFAVRLQSERRLAKVTATQKPEGEEGEDTTVVTIPQGGRRTVEDAKKYADTRGGSLQWLNDTFKQGRSALQSKV